MNGGFEIFWYKFCYLKNKTGKGDLIFLTGSHDRMEPKTANKCLTLNGEMDEELSD